MFLRCGEDGFSNEEETCNVAGLPKSEKDMVENEKVLCGISAKQSIDKDRRVGFGRSNAYEHEYTKVCDCTCDSLKYWNTHDISKKYLRTVRSNHVK